MVERARARIGLWAGAALAVAAVITVVVIVLRSQRLPEGVQPIAWEREVCARCHMHISEASFAAQLQSEDGQVLDFDDPGCLILHEAEQRSPVHAIYFHHVREDRWLSRAEVAFLPGQTTPMGYGFGAVPLGTPGSLSYAEVRERLLGRKDGRR